MSGVMGAVAVLCLMASTDDSVFHKAIRGFEFVTPSLPLLNSAEVLTLMKECAVHEQYLIHPSFLQLLEDTGGVPRLLRKVIEGLTVEFSEGSIAEARTNALRYVESGHLDLSEDERAALIPYIVLGVSYPPMSSPLADSPASLPRFTTGAIFHEANQLVMPVLLLEALFLLCSTSLVGRLIHSYHQRTGDGFAKFCALFHALKMKHLSELQVQEVYMGDFYRGAVMSPQVAALKFKLSEGAKYKVTDISTHQFPGGDEARNKKCVSQLQRGSIFLNAPAGDCLMVNPLGDFESGTLVRSLCVAHTTDDHLTLDTTKIGEDHRRAKKTFELNPELFGKDTKVVSVHLSNRALHAEAKTPRKDCVVIGRDEVPEFFGPTFQMGLLSATHAVAQRVADSPRLPSRGYCTFSRAGGSRPCVRPTPVPPLFACGTLLRNLARRLLQTWFQ